MFNGVLVEGISLVCSWEEIRGSVVEGISTLLLNSEAILSCRLMSVFIY